MALPPKLSGGLLDAGDRGRPEGIAQLVVGTLVPRRVPLHLAVAIRAIPEGGYSSEPYSQYPFLSVDVGPGGLTHALGLESLVLEVDPEGAIAGVEAVALALGHGDGVAGLLGKEALGVHVHVEGGDGLGLLLAGDLGEGGHGADGEGEDGCGVHLV